MSKRQKPHDDDEPSFGGIIRTYREQAGLNQEQLAALTTKAAAALAADDPYTLYEGVARLTILRWENDQTKPSKSAVKVLAYALAPALAKWGIQLSAEDIRERLLIALEPQIPITAVSWYAAKLDQMISFFPEHERHAKWKGIYAWVKAELEARDDIPKWDVSGG